MSEPFLLSHLPHDIILYIFLFLPIQDLCTLSQVSHEIKNIADQDFLWWRICDKTWPYENKKDSKIPVQQRFTTASFTLLQFDTPKKIYFACIHSSECLECERPPTRHYYLDLLYPPLPICLQCQSEGKTKYSLISHTKALSKYVLTRQQLESVGSIKRRHRGKKCILYLETEVQHEAIKIHGSMASLVDERELKSRRSAEKKHNQNENQKKRLNELKTAIIDEYFGQITTTDLIDIANTPTFADLTDSYVRGARGSTSAQVLQATVHAIGQQLIDPYLAHRRHSGK